jgi:hypothetical protein
MIKAIVLSPSYNYYTLYIRNKGLNPHEYPYYIPNSPEKIRGLDSAIPIYWLEGWSENNYSKNDIQALKARFNNHTNISKGWIENEGFKF